MTLFRAVLVFHVAVGTGGLVLGPVAMTALKGSRLHAWAGEIYHWVVLAVCVSAAGLAWLDWGRNWWFLPIAVGSYAFAFVGYVVAKRRGPGWLAVHVSGQGGSYIAMLTAILVVNWQLLTGTSGRATLWPWIIPTIVGSPIIAWVNVQVGRGRRPRLARRATPR